MNVLIVGAGAVGSVYGEALAKAGDKVTFWIREKYRAELQDGIKITDLTLMGARSERTFTNFQLASKIDEVEAAPDEIWLCVSKPAVKGNWVEELANAFPEAQFVSFQPGLHDFADLQKRIPKQMKSGGVIGLVSYQPHEGNAESTDMTVFHPPSAPTMIFGDRALDIVDRLNRGSCPAKLEPDALKIAPQMSAILITFVLTLELVDWSVEGFRKSDDVRSLWEKVALQSFNATCRELDATPISAKNLITKRWMFGAALKYAPKAAPFDVEAYLKFHFLKVRDQSIAMIKEYRDTARRHELPNDAIETLMKRLSP